MERVRWVGPYVFATNVIACNFDIKSMIIIVMM